MKNTHKLTIACVDLVLNSELTRRINGIALSSSGVTKMQAAVVCALELLDENCRLKLLLEDEKNQ